MFWEPLYYNDDWEGGQATLCDTLPENGKTGEAPTDTPKTWGAAAINRWKYVANGDPEAFGDVVIVAWSSSQRRSWLRDVNMIASVYQCARIFFPWYSLLASSWHLNTCTNLGKILYY